MHNANWDDLRYALAVAEAGTVSAAARKLGVNHATVVRRIAGLEEDLGQALFEKTPQGYRLPENRRGLLDALREVEAATLAVGRAAGRTYAGRDEIKLTSTDTLSVCLLPKVLARMTDGAKLRLICSNQHLDLARMDADVAIRPAVRLQDDLVGEVAGDLEFGVFKAPDGASDWLGLSGALTSARPARWLADNIPETDFAGASDSFLVLRELAAMGQGQAILPRIIVEGDARLVEVKDAMPPMAAPIWVVSHSDLADVPRLKNLRARLAAEIAAVLG